jgi:hypothetical protein
MYQEDERLSLTHKLVLQQKDNPKTEFQIHNDLLYQKGKLCVSI